MDDLVVITDGPGDDAAIRDKAARLADALNVPLYDGLGGVDAHAMLLAVTAGGLELRESAASTAARVRCDFLAIDLRTGTGNLSRRQPLGRAIGRETRTVVDATAGLGHDAVLLALMGCEVLAVERVAAAAALLQDGIRIACEDDAFRAALGARLSVVHADAREMLRDLDEPPDAVYIDPMYPPRRKASALPKKGARLLRRLAGDDEDAGEVLAAALARARRRVVVKRPTHASPLGGPPSFAVECKLVRYDVYTIR